jgi:hypothetical protein
LSRHKRIIGGRYRGVNQNRGEKSKTKAGERLETRKDHAYVSGRR